MVTIKSMAQTKRKRDLLITRIAFILDTSLSSTLIILSPSFILFQIGHSSLISLTYGHSLPGGEVMAITNYIDYSIGTVVNHIRGIQGGSCQR